MAVNRQKIHTSATVLTVELAVVTDDVEFEPNEVDDDDDDDDDVVLVMVVCLVLVAGDDTGAGSSIEELLRDLHTDV